MARMEVETFVSRLRHLRASGWPRWQRQWSGKPGVPKTMPGGWGRVDPHPAHPPLVTKTMGSISLSCWSAGICQTGPNEASPCRTCVHWNGTGLDWHLQHPPSTLMAFSVLSPAATLKCKQDELHRKALQTLER